MAVGYRIVPSAVFAAATGAKTFLLAIAPAGHGLVLTSFCLSMDGVTASAVPASVDIVQSTQAGAGTPVSVTISQVRGRGSGGSAPTGGCNYTVEPTTLTVVDTFYLPQFMGILREQFPLGRELETDSSGGTIKAIGIRINVSASVNVKGYLEVESVG